MVVKSFKKASHKIYYKLAKPTHPKVGNLWSKKETVPLGSHRVAMLLSHKQLEEELFVKYSVHSANCIYKSRYVIVRPQCR